MVIAEFNILASFYCFNEEYFGGILPIPHLKGRHGWRTLGYFYYQIDAPFGMSETIEISDFYDYTEYEFRNILIHEMIHYYLYYTGEDPRCRHGKAFKAMAKRFNREYGMNITPTIDTSMMKPSCNASKVSKFFFKIFN